MVAAATALPTLNSAQLAFLTLINNYRAQNGAGALQVSVALQNSSQWMSTDMATNNYFSHTDSLGRAPGARFVAFGYPYGTWGENIAAGFADAQSTLNQFINACDADSTGACTYAHRQNMLDPSYEVMGIGQAYRSTSTNGWYCTTDFGGVLDQTLNTGATPVPTISSFVATPASVSAGQSSVLSWSVSGATSLSIDNGVGSVSTVATKPVTPVQTTTYTLSAVNSGGTSTAQVTVTVKASDTQPPSAPTITSDVAKSSTEVDLMWSASSDNVGVAGYQITRNGVVLTSVGGSSLSYADTSVTGGNTYTYSIKAYDAAGNYSAASASSQVTTPAVAVSVNAVSVSPNSGSGATQIFTFLASDSTGFANISSVQVLIGGALNSAGACYIYVVPSSNQMYLLNDAGSAWTGPGVLGTSTLQNSQCTINGTGSSTTGSGNNLTVHLSLTFPSGFAGLKNIYFSAQDKGGLSSNWQTLGSWTVPGAAHSAPSVSVTPNTGSGSSAAFTFAFSDSSGFADVGLAEIDIAPTLTGTKACWIYVIPSGNQVYLANDTASQWTGPLTLGSSGTLQNSQCTIAGTGSTFTGAGNTLSLKLAISFPTASLGADNIYAFVQSNGGLSSNWQQIGSWTVTK